MATKKLAMLTHYLHKSGIADYNAQFLPYLAKHFKIDLYVEGYKVTINLTSAFHIYDVKDFESCTSYDAILYEIEFEFHAPWCHCSFRDSGFVRCIFEWAVFIWIFNTADYNRR